MIQALTDAVIYYGGLALLHGSVLALLTWLVTRTILRRSRPAVQAALWVIVLVKFFLPPVLPGEMALSSWVARTMTTSSVPVEAIDSTILWTGTSESAADNSVAAIWAGITYGLLAGYVVIFLLLLARAVWRMHRARSYLRALPPADEATRAEVEGLVARIGLKSAPEVRIADDGLVPFVLGFRRTILVLPAGFLQLLQPLARQAMILHELAHLRRRDYGVRWLQNLALTVFYFCPPVRWVCRRIEHFTEIACDQWALAVSQIEPYEYARSLVTVIKGSRPVSRSPMGLMLVPNVARLEVRLRTILEDDAGRSPRLSSRGKGLLILWSLFVLAGGAEVVTSNASPDLAQPSVISDEAPSSQNPQASQAGSRKASHGERGKRAAMAQGNEPLARRQTDLRQNAPQAELRRETSEPSRQESKAGPHRTDTFSSSQALSPYEEGYRLGRQYAEERNRLSQAGLQGQAGEVPSAEKARRMREIELRMQRITAQPSRQ